MTSFLLFPVYMLGSALWLMIGLLPIMMYVGKDKKELELTYLSFLGMLIFLPVTLFGLTIAVLVRICKEAYERQLLGKKRKVIFKRTRQ